MRFLAATNNRHKMEEIRRILIPAGHTVVSLAEAGVESDPPERGETFADNALVKAQEAARISGMPAIGDDSGLEVDALGGAPGVRSARFAGSHGDDEANVKKLLSLLERTPYAARTARFVCVVALVMPDGPTLQVEGEVRGTIGFHPIGENGFGYDPVFFYNNKSFAALADEEKDAVSHRASALKRMVQELPAFLASSSYSEAGETNEQG